MYNINNTILTYVLQLAEQFPKSNFIGLDLSPTVQIPYFSRAVNPGTRGKMTAEMAETIARPTFPLLEWFQKNDWDFS